LGYCESNPAYTTPFLKKWTTRGGASKDPRLRGGSVELDAWESSDPLGANGRQLRRINSESRKSRLILSALFLFIRRGCDFFLGITIFLGTRTSYQDMNCHPDRSEAKWRDLLFGQSALKS
jgi:hypothetical protein